MSLAVMGPGFARTGTMSLKLALETLGFGPCHHFAEVVAHPEQVPHWLRVAAGKSVFRTKYSRAIARRWTGPARMFGANLPPLIRRPRWCLQCGQRNSGGPVSRRQ